MPDDREWKARTGQKIGKLYAWVAEESDGGEGVIAGALPGMPGMTPLIGADRERIESYRGYAEMIARKTGCRARLKVFGAGTVIDEV